VKFSVHVEIAGREGIANPQGLTIERALPALGFSGVSDVKVGKVVRFELDAADETAARAEATAMCDQLLANPVIESASVTIEKAAAPR
jgi:phosphoribosylformylglycinamidine synthase subunit PurS